MTPTLWIGIIILVCILECVRIGMTTYVLLQLLQAHSLRRPCERTAQAVHPLRTASSRFRREALLDPTLLALRDAMDDIAQGTAGISIEGAIDALDRYALALVEERNEG